MKAGIREIMEKHFRFVYLLDLYGGLLTEKQYNILNDYYNEDLSLSEIAESQGVTRQAAFDLLKRAEHILLDYDGKLHLFEKYLENKETVEQIRLLCKTENPELLRQLDLLEKNL
jgi:predicted DNA-binding protein YlxM (UPF0122 family)